MLFLGFFTSLLELLAIKLWLGPFHQTYGRLFYGECLYFTVTDILYKTVQQNKFPSLKKPKVAISGREL